MITLAGVYVTVYDVLAETQNSNLYHFAIYQFCETLWVWIQFSISLVRINHSYIYISIYEICAYLKLYMYVNVKFFAFSSINSQLQTCRCKCHIFAYQKAQRPCCKIKGDCKKIDATTPMFPWTIVAKKIYWKWGWKF